MPVECSSSITPCLQPPRDLKREVLLGALRSYRLLVVAVLGEVNHLALGNDG